MKVALTLGCTGSTPLFERRPARYEFTFVTSGDSTDQILNRLSMNYRLRFSPDDMDVVGRIREDGTVPSRPEMENRNRDGSVWLVDGQSTNVPCPGGATFGSPVRARNRGGRPDPLPPPGG